MYATPNLLGNTFYKLRRIDTTSLGGSAASRDWSSEIQAIRF